MNPSMAMAAKRNAEPIGPRIHAGPDRRRSSTRRDLDAQAAAFRLPSSFSGIANHDARAGHGEERGEAQGDLGLAEEVNAGPGEGVMSTATGP